MHLQKRFILPARDAVLEKLEDPVDEHVYHTGESNVNESVSGKKRCLLRLPH